MGLLKRWISNRSLNRMRERVQAAPSIANYADLARAFATGGDLDEAERILEEGLDLFPRTSELERLRRLVKSQQLSDRTREVRRRLEFHPTPALFHELVELQLQCNDPAAAEVTVADWRRLFPADAGVELASIKIALRRFYSERAAADGRAAYAGLERLLQRDPGHARALRLLAELCSRIGALSQAADALTRLSQIVPDDPGVARWRETIEMGLAKNDRARVDLSRALRDVEETGQFPDPVAPDDDPEKIAEKKRRAAPRALDAARPAFARLAKCDGVRLVVLVRGSAALVRGARPGTAEAIARAARAISVSAKRTTRRLGLGAFVEVVAETDDGVLVLRGADSASASAVVDRFSRLGSVRGAVADLAAAPPVMAADVSEGTGGELVHA